MSSVNEGHIVSVLHIRGLSHHLKKAGAWYRINVIFSANQLGRTCAAVRNRAEVADQEQ